MKRKRNNSNKYVGKYYKITSLYNGALSEYVIAFKVIACQKVTKNRWILKLYTNGLYKEESHSNYKWSAGKVAFHSDYEQEKFFKDTGNFPISGAEFANLMNHDTEELNKKGITKLLLKR